MPGGNKAIRPEDNPKPFKKGNKANPHGQPPSIRRKLRELLKEEGVLRIEKKEVLRINEDGSIDIKVPSQMMLALKLEKWAISNNGNESLKAIQMIMEQVDGKPLQTIETQSKINIDPKQWIKPKK